MEPRSDAGTQPARDRALDDTALPPAWRDEAVEALSSLGVGLVVVKGTAILHANPAFCELTGHSLAELRTLKSALYLSPYADRIQHVDRLVASFTSARSVTTFTTRIMTKDGREVPVAIEVAPANAEGQAVIFVRPSATKHGLVVSAERLLEAYEALGDPVTLVDGSANVIHTTAPGTSAIGVPFASAFPSLDSPAVRAALEGALKRGARSTVNATQPNGEPVALDIVPTGGCAIVRVRAPGAQDALPRSLATRLVGDVVDRGHVEDAVLRSIGRDLARELAAPEIATSVASFTQLGLGDLGLIESSEGSYTFVGKDLIERREKSPRPTCLLTLSFLEGIVAECTGGAALGAELQCESRGHERCVFLVKERPRQPKKRPGKVK